MNRQREDSTGTRRDTNSGARGCRTKKLSLYAPGNETLIRKSGKLQGSFCNADVIEIYSFLGVFFFRFWCNGNSWVYPRKVSRRAVMRRFYCFLIDANNEETATYTTWIHEKNHMLASVRQLVFF